MGNNTLPTDFQRFIALSRYAKWLDKEGRRETFAETVDRYIDNVVLPVVGGTEGENYAFPHDSRGSS
jgi:hypothetical protein